jgi:hypothetical protein
MTQSFIVSQKSKTVGGQSIAISGAANNGSGAIRLSATAHGLETGDIVQNSAIGGTVEANAQWVITVIDANHFDLNNSTFAHAYTSGGTAAHVGYATAGLDVSNVLFPCVPNNLTAVVKLESAPVNVTCRAILEDSADVNFVTAMPAFTTAFAGGVAPGNDLRRAFRYWDDPDTRLAASGDNLRLKIMWGKPVAGAVFQFSAFLEY